MTFQASRIASKRLRAFFAGIVLALGTLGVAHAQNILVINEETILTESQVGRHIAGQLEVIGREIQTELEAAAQPLTQENEALQAETSALSQEAIQQRPDLIQRAQQLQQNAQQLERLRRLRQQELVATERQALQPVLQALEAVLQEVVNERNATVLLDRSQVVFAADSVDVTSTVVERLNQRIQTTPVTRVRAPENGQ
ncbi:OmpH family outer membrane protein [Glycocaulis abyssi]|uniref:OmpH family outer membrane protein n=1 Tax=Glycocaulis abyssi TaxID=1433403 RepID=A0ABV9N7C5_9PROT